MKFRRESENRERIKNRGIKAAVLRERPAIAVRSGGFEVKNETVAVAVAAGESTTAASTEDVPASVEMKANDENDDEEEDDDGAEHDFATYGKVVQGRRRQGIYHGGFH